MQKYSKKIKLLLREYMIEAYEKELHRELIKLDQSFAEWRDGKISSGELSHRIHEYETGPSRKLFKKYNYNPDKDLLVAYAIVVGILDQEKVPEDLLEAISDAINFYRSLQERNKLRETDGK